MAIRIPRAETVRTVEAVAPEAGQSDYSGLDRIGRQLTQVGSQLRENQQNLDLAEAKTRIYAARKLAQAQADEQGLYGDQYTQFMSTAVAKARDEVSGLTELPEVKRALTNEGMVRQQADEIEFRAEGFRRQIQNDNARIERNVDMLGHAAQNEFWIASGDIDPKLYELMDNGQITGESRAGFTEEERRLAGETARSFVGLRAGLEMIEGWTVNGQGDPASLLRVLNNEGHDFTRRLTEQHRWDLKQRAEQKLAQIGAARSSQREAVTERYRTVLGNAEEIREGGGYVPEYMLDELDKLGGILDELYQVRSDEYVLPTEYQINPDKEEIARQLRVRGDSFMQVRELTKDMQGLPTQSLQGVLRHYEQMQSQAVMSGEMPQIDTVVGPDGSPMWSGESMALDDLVTTLRGAVRQRQESRRKGETLDLYNRYVGGDERISMDFNWADPDQSAQLLAMKSESVEAASMWAGYPVVPISGDQASDLMDRVAAGMVSDQDLAGIAAAMESLPGYILEEQALAFGDDQRWFRGLMYASSKNNERLAQYFARGVAMEKQGLTKSEKFWASDGQDKLAENDLTALFTETFPDDPAVAADMANASKMLVYGMAESQTNNSWSTDDAAAYATMLFDNGADVAGGRIYPRPIDEMGEPTQLADILRNISVDDLNGYVLPSLGLADIVDDQIAGNSAEEVFVIMMRRAGRSGLERPQGLNIQPHPGKEGVYFIGLTDPAYMGDMGDRGFFADAEGRPLEFNFNELQARRNRLMFADDAWLESRGLQRPSGGGAFEADSFQQGAALLPPGG